MRIFLSVCLWVACLSFSQACIAQMMTEPEWSERNGLVVASSQTVVVPATKLRFFVTIESTDAEPQQAIADLNKKKKSAMAVLREMGVSEQAAKFTAVRIAELEEEPNGVSYRGDSSRVLHSVELESRLNTAVMHLSFDISLEGMDAEKRVLLFHGTYLRLRRDAALGVDEIEAVYVGEIKNSQIAGARKKAYDEALADAKSLASLTGKPLGKLVALTAGADGRYWSELSYVRWGSERMSASHFAPSENEVFSTNASKLSRKYSVELRFNLE